MADDGEALVDDQKVDKPGTMVKPDVKITLLGKKMPYEAGGWASRAKSLEVFPIDFTDKAIADSGSLIDAVYRLRPAKRRPEGICH